MNEKFASKREAQKRVAEVEYHLSRDCDPRTGLKFASAIGLTWPDAIKLFSEWSARKGRAPRTLERDLEFIIQFSTEYPEPPERVKPETIERFLVELRGKKLVGETGKKKWVTDPKRLPSPSTLNKAVFGLKALFRCLMELGYTAQSPARAVSSVKVPDSIPDILTTEELSRLIQAFSDFHRPFALFVAVMGCRISEVCNLTWDDVELPRVTIRAPKEKRDKVLVLPPGLREVLKQLPHTSKYVFPNETGGRRHHSLGYLIKRAATRAGLNPERIHWHMLRHTAATRLVMSESPAVVQRILGHARLQTTERYLHVQSTYLEQVAEGSMTEFLGEITGKKCTTKVYNKEQRNGAGTGQVPSGKNGQKTGSKPVRKRSPAQ